MNRAILERHGNPIGSFRLSWCVRVGPGLDFLHDSADTRVVYFFVGELLQRYFPVEQSDGENERHAVRSGDRFLGIGSAERAEMKITLNAFDIVSREAMLLAQCQ